MDCSGFPRTVSQWMRNPAGWSSSAASTSAATPTRAGGEGSIICSALICCTRPDAGVIKRRSLRRRRRAGIRARLGSALVGGNLAVVEALLVHPFFPEPLLSRARSRRIRRRGGRLRGVRHSSFVAAGLRPLLREHRVRRGKEKRYGQDERWSEAQMHGRSRAAWVPELAPWQQMNHSGSCCPAYWFDGCGIERPLSFSATMNSRKRRLSVALGFQ